MKQHPHAEILRAIADGEPLENFEIRGSDSDWQSWQSLANGWMDWLYNPEDWYLRRKQKTIVVNGFEVPEPVREPLEKGQMYWMPLLHSTDYVMFVNCTGGATVLEQLALKRGFLHLTKEAAVAHAKAMLGIDPKEQA